MKHIIFFIMVLFSFSSLANDVVVVNEQKLVLIETKTTLAVDKILKSSASNEQKIVALKAAFQKETSFCSIAAATYEITSDKCERVLSKKHFYEELVSDGMEYSSISELREIISQYLSIIILL